MATVNLLEIISEVLIFVPFLWTSRSFGVRNKLDILPQRDLRIRMLFSAGRSSVWLNTSSKNFVRRGCCRWIGTYVYLLGSDFAIFLSLGLRNCKILFSSDSIRVFSFFSSDSIGVFSFNFSFDSTKSHATAHLCATHFAARSRVILFSICMIVSRSAKS